MAVNPWCNTAIILGTFLNICNRKIPHITASFDGENGSCQLPVCLISTGKIIIFHLHICWNIHCLCKIFPPKFIGIILYFLQCCTTGKHIISDTSDTPCNPHGGNIFAAGKSLCSQFLYSIQSLYLCKILPVITPWNVIFIFKFFHVCIPGSNTKSVSVQLP